MLCIADSFDCKLDSTADNPSDSLPRATNLTRKRQDHLGNQLLQRTAGGPYGDTRAAPGTALKITGTRSMRESNVAAQLSETISEAVVRQGIAHQCMKNPVHRTAPAHVQQLAQHRRKDLRRHLEEP